MEKHEIRVGDWVRFSSCGHLVIGVVHYIMKRKSWERADTIITDIGATSTDNIHEVRRHAR